jgi:hypothetical protein
VICLGFLPQTPFNISSTKVVEDKSFAHSDEQQKVNMFIEKNQQVHGQVEEHLQKARCSTKI